MKVFYKLLVCTLVLLGCGALAYQAHAIPVKAGAITVTQPDGSKITIRMYGDEWASYITTDDGYGIERGEDGFFYYVENSGKLSSVKARPASARTAADRAAMANVKRGVPYGEMNAKRASFMAQNPQLAYRAPAEAPRTSDRNLVILVEYSDKEFVVSSPNSYFTEFLNGDNFTQNGATGSVKKYYNDNSNGVYNATFDVPGPYKASKTHSYYSNYSYLSSRVPELVREILNKMANEGFDFSPYAVGNKIDQICLIYCGNNRAEGGTGIHPHQYYVGVGGSATIGGYTFNKYLVTSELRDNGSTAAYAAGIGTFTHEYGHIIGLPDYYDTNYATQNLTPSTYFVMDMGGYNNNGRTPSALSAINRWLLGWIEPEPLETSGNYTLPYIESSNKAYIIRISGTNGSDVGEYYLLETRSSTLGKWDKGLTSPLYSSITGGSAARDGMFVMHIDRRSGTQLNKWSSNSVNDTNGHPNARPVCAVTTTYNNNYGTWTNQNRWVFPGYGNVTTLNSTTHPTFKPWAGTNDHKLTNIAYSNGTVTFDLAVGDTPVPDPIPFRGTVKNASNQNVSSGTVTLTRQITTTGANSTTKLSPVSGATFTATISNGNFTFNDVKEEGTYIASINASGYQTHNSVVNVTNNGSAALVVDTPIESSYTRKSWAPSYSTSVKYTAGTDMIIGSKFDYADFGVTGKVAVYGADYHLSSTAGVELQVYDGSNNKLHSVPVSNILTGNSKYVDLTSLDLSLNSGESIVIAYKLSGYSGSYPATMSATTSNRDKGALIKSTESAQWSTGDANWVIGIYADEQKATGVVFDATSMDTYVGNIENITYSFTPAGTSSTLTWKSSNTGVASVDPTTGEIKCWKAGTANITATLPNNASATCRITVAPEIDGSLKIEVNNTDKKAVVSWTPAIERDTWVLQWKPKGGSYTKVTSKQPSVTIENLVWGTEYEVTVNGQRSDNKIWGETTGTFKSEKPSATGVTLTKTKLDTFVGDKETLEYKMIPEDGIAALNWASSDTSVLTVDGDGTIKPLKAGKATVTVSSNDFTGTATCEVTVSSEIDGDVTVEVDNLAKSASVEWKAATTRSQWNYRLVIDGTQTKADKVTKTEIELTNLPAGAQGELFISGVRSDGEVWGETRTTFQITDKPAAEKITLNQTEANLFINEEMQLTATVTPENAYNSEVEWSSSDTSVVTVDQTGLITGTGNGEAVITVKTKVGNVSATCAVTVTNDVAPVKAITVYQSDAEFEWPGSQHQGTFEVEVFAENIRVYTKTVDDDYIYIPYLSPGTTYEIVVKSLLSGGYGSSSTLEFTTEARTGKFASMRDIKGSYTADELVPLRITNIQGDVQSIVWKVGNNTVAPPSVKLNAGRHEIKATVTRKDGHKEVITKFVNIQ